ncbi:MAG: VWA domain-containing protein [Verrucomicrobiota bacterium]
MIFASPERFIWMVLVPLLAALLIYAGRRRGASLRNMFRNRPEKPMGGPGAGTVQAVLICCAVISIVIALARPGWNPRMERLTRESRDVVFLLDVSNSMHGRDRLPNRMENAKAMIVSCLDRLAGDQRVGLVVFAGSSSIACPLTQDIRFFIEALEKTGPESVSQGGTRIGDALLKAADKLLTEKMRGFQDVILITDGGDQESEPLKAVEVLNELDASLMVVGVGDTGDGVRIPVRDERRNETRFMTYDGQEVRTRLELEQLKRLVDISANGLFLPAGIRPVNLADVYEKFVMHLEKKEIFVESVEQVDEGFFWFIGLALGFLMVGATVRIALPWKLTRRVAGLLLLCGLGLPETAEAASSPEKLYNQGNHLLRLGDHGGAVTAYEDALNEAGPDLRARCFYNLGVTVGAMAEEEASREDIAYERVYELLARSMSCFRAACDLSGGDRNAARNLELVRLKYAALKRKQEARENAASDDEEAPSEEGEEGQPEEQEGESEDSEESEYSEEEMEGDPRASSRMPPDSTTLTDLENQSLPPPNLTPEDLLNEEIRNNQLRDKRRRSKGRGVEKDW